MKLPIYHLLVIILVGNVIEVISSDLEAEEDAESDPSPSENAGSTSKAFWKKVGKLKLVRTGLPVLKDAPKLTSKDINTIAKQESSDASKNKTAQKSGGKVSIGARIIKGQLAKRGDFPWQVGILIDDENFCGGSLISSMHVLTAAHCIFEKRLFEMVFAAQNRSYDEEGVVTRISSKGLAHSGYNARTMKHDIAIIYLREPVYEAELIKKIRLPHKTRHKLFFKRGVPMVVAGWGRTSENETETSDDLKTFKLTSLTSVDCIKSYGKSSFTETNMCAIGKNGDATCQGDSGGPLLYKDPTDGIYTQVGLVSYGAAEGCELGFPEVYTKVSKYINWISKNTGLRF